MSITDELREFASHCAGGMGGDALTNIADRIDEEHKREVVKGLNEHQHGRDEGWDEAVALMDREYVHLPVDADGVPIHIGDVMDSKVDYLFDGRPFEVRAMRRDECEWEVYDRLGDRYEPNSLRHHHEPTIEDVLREFVDEFNRDDTEMCDDEIIERFAGRIREVVEHERI